MGDTPPPLSLRHCLIDGHIDMQRYTAYRRKKNRRQAQTNGLKSIVQMKYKKNITTISIIKRKPRSIKKHRLWIRENDGQLRELKYTDTLWYLFYLKEPPRNNRLRKQFRNRFRIPYDKFLELVDNISHHELFKRWTRCDCTKAPSSSIQMLLLGTLRYIGRAHTFDDIEEASAISRETHRQFFNVFLEYGSTVLYRMHVTDAMKNTPISEFEDLFASAGFNGCIGSTDATHVGMLSCASWAAIAHKGHKLNIPSRSYNATVSHCRQILGTTCGHPSTWNDKSIILYDELVRGVHEGEVFDNYTFKLLF